MAAAEEGNFAAVKYSCEERGVPVNFVSPDEASLSVSENERIQTPLMAALHKGQEEMVLYLLSLPRGEDCPPLNINTRLEPEDCSLLTVAAEEGMARLVEALLGKGADLLARDATAHLAVCLAVSKRHVEVVNVLMKAHALRGGVMGEQRMCWNVPADTTHSSFTRWTPYPTSERRPNWP